MPMSFVLPHLRVGGSIAAILILVAAGCTAGSDENLDGGFEAVHTCEELAQRWGDIQQSFLDDLAESSAANLEPLAARLGPAARRVGASLIEQARDAELAGCTRELQAGSPLLCAQSESLRSGGAAGDAYIDQLERGCG